MSSIAGADARRDAWMRPVLRLAGIYNLAWGAFVALLPGQLFAWAGMPPPNYPEIWQCVGMVVGVYGVGYLIAAADPMRHWPIVLVGFLGKLLGPIGFLDAALHGRLPWVAGWVNVTNDLLWLPLFAAILWRVHQAHRAEAEDRLPAIEARR